MNILIVFDSDLSPTVAGGATRMTHLLADSLSELCNFDVWLGYFNKHEVPSPLANKFHITAQSIKSDYEHFLKENRIEIIVVSTVRKQDNLFIPKIYNIAHQNNIKVIQWLHGLPGEEVLHYGSFEHILYALKTKEKIVRNFKDYFITQCKKLLTVPMHQYLFYKYRMRYENCDAYVILSKSYITKYSKIARLKNNDKFYTIGNALTFKEKIDEATLVNKQNEILIVANLNDAQKRISLALKVWKTVERKNNKWKLRIVGDGKDKAFIQYLAKKMKLKNIAFEGWKKPLEYYKTASIFIMTSAWEGFPMTLLESQQMGIVPIAFNSFGAIYDVIENGINGVIVPNNNIKLFANSMLHLMENKTMRQEMAKNALQSSERFTLETIINKWITLFQSIQTI